MTQDRILQTSSDSEAGPPTLVSIGLDLHIIICILLHPSDILALRKTCKTLQIPTRRRTVWLAALRRVCIDNSLFLPTFPILEMSDAELEHAAMAPCRWIELCAAFEKQHPNGPGARLSPKTTRVIDDSLLATDRREFFIVPGGRYLVSHSPKGVLVWDLGYTSSAECKLIASIGPEGVSYDCMVQATPDGMGLVILTSRSHERCSVYEIYPQSETPQLTHIASLDLDPSKRPRTYLLPDRVVWYEFYGDRIVFRVWDYRANHSTSFTAEVDVRKFRYCLEVIATKTAIFVLSAEQILVWAIPALSPQPLNFSNQNPTHIPSRFGIAFPNDTVSQAELWQTMSHWYFGSSQPLYFDVLCGGSKLHRFEIIVKPNLSDTSLRIIKTETVPYDFDDVIFEPYRICEDTLVTCWENNDPNRCGVYSGLTSSHSTTAISHNGPAAKMLFPPTASIYPLVLCPTSGRYVHLDDDIPGIFVVDLF